MPFSKTLGLLLLPLVIGPFFTLQAKTNLVPALAIREHYENREISKALELVYTNSPGQRYLRGILLKEAGKKESAFSNFLGATNDPMLRDYAFYRLGTLYPEKTNSLFLNYLKKSENAQNILIRYYSSLAIGENYLERKRPQYAAIAFQKAYDTLLKLDAPYYKLTDILGSFYKSKNEYLIGQSLHESKNAAAADWLKRVLITGGDARSNPYVEKALTLLTNYKLVTYQEQMIMAKHLIRLKKPAKKIKTYLNAALVKATSSKEILAALELMFESPLNQDIPLMEKELKLYSLYFQNNPLEDALLFYKGQMANRQMRTQIALSNFHAVRKNRFSNKDYESRALLWLIEFQGKKKEVSLAPLFLSNRREISNSPNLSDALFKHALDRYYLKKDFSNTLLFLTNLPPTPQSLYIQSIILTSNRSLSNAALNLSRIIRENSSDYYTAKALEDLPRILQRIPLLEQGNRSNAQKILNTIHIQKESLGSIGKKLMEVLSLDPDFTLSKEFTDRIISSNHQISVLLKKTNDSIPPSVRYCFEMHLEPEGRMELFNANIQKTTTTRDLAEFFLALKYPYMQIKYSESLKSLLNFSFPVYRIKHPYSRHLFPAWYKDEVAKNAQKNSTDPDLILSLIREESRFRYDARSPVGAMGLMQVMPATFQSIRKDLKMVESNILAPQANITAGTYYIRLMMDRFNNNTYAAAAYNAGPNAVAKWLASSPPWDEVSFVENIPYKETKNYVKKVYYSWKCYNTFRKWDLED